MVQVGYLRPEREADRPAARLADGLRAQEVLRLLVERDAQLREVLDLQPACPALERRDHRRLVAERLPQVRLREPPLRACLADARPELSRERGVVAVWGLDVCLVGGARCHAVVMSRYHMWCLIPQIAKRGLGAVLLPEYRRSGGPASRDQGDAHERRPQHHRAGPAPR